MQYISEKISKRIEDQSYRERFTDLSEITQKNLRQTQVF